MNLPPESISTAHRLGRKPANQTQDKRSLIVKFVRRDLKHDLLKASRQQAKPPRIYVAESLTPPRQSIFYALRRMKKAKMIQGCNSYEGRVYAFTKNPAADRDLRHLISGYEDLKKFCRNYVKEPLEKFLETWNH